MREYIIDDGDYRDEYEVSGPPRLTFIRFKSKNFPFDKLPRKISDRAMCILMKLFVWQKENEDICPFGFFPYNLENFETKIRRSKEDIFDAINIAIKLNAMEEISDKSFYTALENAFFQHRDNTSSDKTEEINNKPMKHVEYRQTEQEQEEWTAVQYPEFPCRDSQKYTPTQELINELENDFPDVDLMGELELARQWLVNFPSKKKSVGGMPKYLRNWFEKAQEHYKKEKPKTETEETERKETDNNGREVL